MDSRPPAPIQAVPSLRVLQINLNKSQAATAELGRLGLEGRFDVALIQEPYFRPNSKTLPGLSEQGFRACFAGNPPLSAILVTNPGLSLFSHQSLSDDSITVATISSTTDTFVFVSAYHKGKPRHANVGRNSNATDLLKLSSVIDSFPGHKLCFGIDTNAYSYDWGSTEEDQRGVDLSEFLAADNITLLNDGHLATYCHQTTQASSFIDITAVSAPLLRSAQSWSVSRDTSLSDHRYIVFEFALVSVPVSARTHSKRFCLARADWDLFRRLLEEFKPVFSTLIDQATTSADVEALSASYMECVSAAARQAIPFSRPFSGSKDWWTPSLKALNREARRLRNRLSGRPRDYQQRLAQYKQAYRAFKKAHDKARFESFRQWSTVDTADPWGSIYNMLKTRQQRSAPLKPLVRPDGSRTSTERETIDLLLNKYFPQDNVTADTPLISSARIECLTPPDTSDDLPFSQEEVKSVIWKMKTRRSPGIDLITAPILRVITSVLLPEMTNWFNKCLSLGCFPSPFKKALIKFIPKPNSDLIDTEKAFRPICLLPTTGKALDSLLIKRIEWFLYTNGLMSDNQFGFVPQKSTVDAALHIVHQLEEYRDRDWCVYLFSLDIEGAFDSAIWALILMALKLKNCPKNLYRLAQSYFSDRWVLADTESCSVLHQATMGCMQGSPSGPTFWNILYDAITRLPLPPHCDLILYADDCSVRVAGSSIKVAAERANECLRIIHEWGRSIGLKFNASKTQINERWSRRTEP